MGAFRCGGERRGGGVGRLIEGGGVGRPDGKNLQILDLHRLASLPLLLLWRTRSQKNPWLSYHMSEVKTSVLSEPSAFLEEMPLGEKQ